MSELPQELSGYHNSPGFMASLVEAATDAIFSEDLEGVITSWNRAAERVFGYSAAEIVGQSVTILIPPNRQDERLEISERIKAGERIEHFDTVRQRADGKLIDISLTVSPIYDPKGQICGISKIGRELSDLRLARQQLQASEERYHTLFNSIEEGFSIVELIFDESGEVSDYLFLGTNPAFERQTGLVDAVGRKAKEIAPNLEKIWFERLGTVAKTGESIRFENPVSALNRWFNVYAFRIGEPENHQVAAIFTDITARKRAEEEADRWLKRLAAERSKFEYLFSRSPAFVATLYGPQHTFDLINPAYMKLIGYRDFIGKPAREAVPEAEGQGFFELLDNVYRTGIPFYGEELPLQVQPTPESTPELHYLNFVYQPIFELNGMVSGIFVHGIDVTEQVQAKQDAELANRAKDEFLGMLSNELKAPVNTLLGWSRIATRDLSSEEAIQTLEEIKRSALAQARHIDDILKVSPSQ